MLCLDLQDRRVVKEIHFVVIRDAARPVDCVKTCCAAGADGLAMLVNTATVEVRAIFVDLVPRTVAVVTVPFTLDRGIRDLRSAEAVLSAGADRIGVSSVAVRSPDLVAHLIGPCGCERVDVAIDVDRRPELRARYELQIDGGHTPGGLGASKWCDGVTIWGEPILSITSEAADGARTAYNLPFIGTLACARWAEIVASRGVGERWFFFDTAEAGATILLAANVFHLGLLRIGDVKCYWADHGVPFRQS